jgi:hypothetical protein
VPVVGDVGQLAEAVDRLPVFSVERVVNQGY